MAITIHPDLHSLIPPLSSEEFAQLEINILHDGCRDSLTIWQEEQVLLDGHNRYAICEKHGLPYTLQEISVPSLEAAQAWMVDNQLGRRNLTPEQTAYFRGKQFEYQKKGTRGGGDRRSTTALNQNHQSDGNDTAAQLAAQHKVGKATIEPDAAYARAVDTLADVAGVEVRQAILARDTRLTQHQVKQLAQTAPQRAAEVKDALTRALTATTRGETRRSVLDVLRVGHCNICGRQLTDPASVSRGIGPICVCKPTDTGANGAAPAPTAPGPEARPALSIEAHLEEVSAVLTALVTRLGHEDLPRVIEARPDACRRVALGCLVVMKRLGPSGVIQEAGFQPSATAPKKRPRKAAPERS